MVENENTFISSICNLLSLLPGITFLIIIGLLSKYIGGSIPYISYLIIAIFFGIILANIIQLPAIIEKGIGATHKIWLETGIAILGSQVILNDLLQIGPSLLIMVISFLFLSIILVEYIASSFKLEPELGSCLASGLSICGVSAIIATGGGIHAKKRNIAYGIATVLLFDIVTVFLYPAIGLFFSIPSQVFGPWAGISMLSTGTTVAAGFAHSEVAGQLATVAKMARNSFIGIWALLFTLRYIQRGYINTNVGSKANYLWIKFPKFIIGFLAMMLFSNIDLFNQDQLKSFSNAYNWLFMMAFVGLGYTMNISEIKKTGIQPIVVVSISFISISISSLIISYLIFG